MSASALEARDLQVFYGESQILFGLSLTVAPGRCVALLGRNGAGKSTTLKAIAGLAPPRRGGVTVRGVEMARRKPHLIARAGVGYVPEDRQVFARLSVEDNLTVAARTGVDGSRVWTLETVWDAFPVLLDLRRRAAGRLSGGEQQMLTVARALMGNPAVLLLDEPSEGLAPLIVREIGALLRRLSTMGTAVLLAEQNMHFCLGAASDAVVIDKGRVVWRGAMTALRDDAEARSRYLAA